MGNSGWAYVVCPTFFIKFVRLTFTETMLKSLLYKIKSYAAGIPESRLLIILALVVGLGSGIAAVLLKQMVHFFEWILTGWFNTPADSLLFLLYPGIGMLMAFLFVKHRSDLVLVIISLSREISPNTPQLKYKRAVR